MEKQAAPSNKILKFLPKSVSAVNFHNLTFSPGRGKRSEHTHKHKAISGKGVNHVRSMIPVEVRRRENKNFETQEEPTSPKVSCIGQVKHKKKTNKATYKCVSSAPQETKPVSHTPNQVKKRESKLKRLFTGSKAGRKSNVSDGDKPASPDSANNSLSQMKRFASGRDTLASFDWTAHQIAPVESDNRDYYSDGKTGDGFEDEDEEVIIPFSAPIMVGRGVDLLPRKEINLWKKRTMNMSPPRPLQLRFNKVRGN